MLSLKLDSETEKLRADFSKWLDSNQPPVLSANAPLDTFVEVSRKWQRALAEARWIGVHWPEEFGGRGLTVVQEAVLQELLAERRSPQLVNLFALTMIGPVLIAHGTQEQKERYLQKMLLAEEIWCQGFSEPQAGSDLASVRSTAVKKTENESSYWELNGQKIWTSFAQYADHCFALLRSNPDVPKHKGLSYFLVPMKSEGIDIRPLTQITGEQEFNEVFFDKVKVSPDGLVGSEGDGWKMAISTLMYERVILTFARHLQSEAVLRDIREILSEGDFEESTYSSFGRHVARSMAVRALALSHLLQYSERAPGPEGSLDKLGWSEAFQECCKFGLSLLGSKKLITAGKSVVKEGAFQHRYLYSRGRTIAAGSSEIQRNIIAERILELPKSR